MKLNEQSLRKKGWNEEEISHAKKIASTTNKNNHKVHNKLAKAKLWILFLIITGIAIGGLFLISPFLIFLKPTGAYILIGIIGIIFGLFAGIIVKDIEDLERHHHLIISIIIPIVAIISSLFLSKQVIKSAEILQRTVEIHPWIIAIIFSISTLIPYGIFIWLEEKRKKRI